MPEVQIPLTENSSATVGLFYVALLISRLVVLYSFESVIEDIREKKESGENIFEKHTDFQKQ